MSLATQCNNCLLFNPDQEGRTCDPFPNGIPEAIFTGEHNHLMPFPGDGGQVRSPIKWTGPGTFVDISPEQEAAENEPPIDLSAKRDAQIAELYRYFLDREEFPVGVPTARKTSDDFNDFDFYRAFGGKWIVITRDLIRRINFAVAVLARPDAVFRDSQFQQTTKQNFTINYYIGRVFDRNLLRWIVVRVVSDTVHNLKIARTTSEVPGILSSISGMKLYQRV